MIAELAVATSIPPQALLACSPEMIATLVAVVSEEDA